MRITLVGDYLDVSRGGCESHLWNLARYLNTAGHSVQVYCKEWNSPPKNIAAHRIPCMRHPPLATEWSFLLGVTRRLQASEPHPVLSFRPVPVASHYLPAAGLFEMALKAEREAMESRLRKKLFWPATTLNFKRRLLAQVEKKVLDVKRRPKLMVWSEFICKQLEQAYGIGREEVLKIPAGVDLDRFYPEQASVCQSWRRETATRDDELLLLFAAHNFLLKGLAWLLRALSRARALGVGAKLIVVGRGPIARFKRLADRLAISSQVCFLGAQPQDKLAGIYRAVDALVLPTFYDPCSFVVLEALASGCPVVTTRQAGASEFMESAREGFILNNPRDTEALVEFFQVLQDKPQLQKMKESAALLGRSLDFKTYASQVTAWLQRTTP